MGVGWEQEETRVEKEEKRRARSQSGWRRKETSFSAECTGAHTDLMLVNQVCSVVLYKQKICDHCAGIVTLNYYKYHSLEIKFNPFVAQLETATNVRK